MLVGGMDGLQSPASPLPHTAEELAASPASMLVYLERFGGYKGQKTLGMTMWLLGHCIDAASRGDIKLCLEHLALTIAALEQVGVDQGDWSLGFLQIMVVGTSPVGFSREAATSQDVFQVIRGPDPIELVCNKLCSTQ